MWKLGAVGRGLIFEDEGGMSIKPKPLADFIRFEWFKDDFECFKDAIFKLLNFMPCRISMNVAKLHQIISSKMMVDERLSMEISGHYT